MLRLATAAVVLLLRTVAAAESCDMPGGFSIGDWQSYEPADALDTSGFLTFTLTDADTNLFTPCYMDSYTAPMNATAKVKTYQCDNPAAEFSYDNGMLTVSETICIDQTGAGLFKVSGTVKPDVKCVDAAEQGGTGDICQSAGPTKSSYTDFQPIGVQFPTGPISTVKPGGGRH